MNRIVVGVDGSEGSANALRFALEEARVRGAEMQVVSTWRIPPMLYGAGLGLVPPISGDDFEEIARKAQDKAVAETGADGGEVRLTRLVREGQAADVLCDLAAGADLLIVGSRGLGGFSGLLLGSVSQQCAHHAPCPVVIVPSAREA